MTYLHAIQKVILDVAGLESVGQLTRTEFQYFFVQTRFYA